MERCYFSIELWIVIVVLLICYAVLSHLMIIDNIAKDMFLWSYLNNLDMTLPCLLFFCWWYHLDKTFICNQWIQIEVLCLSFICFFKDWFHKIIPFARDLFIVSRHLFLWSQIFYTFNVIFCMIVLSDHAKWHIFPLSDMLSYH